MPAQSPDTDVYEIILVQRREFPVETNLNQSNLLQSMQIKKTAQTPVQQTAVQPQIQQSAQLPVVINPQPQGDTFVNTKKQGKLPEYVKDYSGLAAIVLTAVGLPVTYKLSRGKNSKQLKDIKTAVDNLASQFSQSGIDEKVAAAVKTATQDIVKRTNPVSAKSALTGALLALGSVFGVNEYVKNNKEDLTKKGYSEEEIKDAKETATGILSKAEEAKNTADGLAGLANEAKAVAYESRNISYDARNNVSSLNNGINEAKAMANSAIRATEVGLNPVMSTYTVRHYDLNLLKVLNDEMKIDEGRKDGAYNFIREAAPKRLNRNQADTIADIKRYRKEHPNLKSIWSLTAEYKPMQLGGLGVVPVDIQNNFIQLGIDSPAFIPMYLKKNQSEFVEENGKYSYIYGKTKFDLTKIAETSTHVYRNGETHRETIEFYSTELPVNAQDGSVMKKTLVFVKNNDYFNDNIYDSTTNAEETEKFALFTKAVYKLAKYKIAESYAKEEIRKLKEKGEKVNDFSLLGIANIKITDREAFDKLQAPGSFLLNDWHAGSMAGLLRYRAPLEYAYNEISETTAEALENAPVVMVGHNLKHQGRSNDSNESQLGKNRVTENIINTLFDSYAIAITENAHSGIINEEDPNNDDMCNTVLLKRKTGDKHFNHAFIGVALSDWFVPVSKTYTKELINDPIKSGILWPLLQERQILVEEKDPKTGEKVQKDTGTVSGTINGYDKNTIDMNAVSSNNRVPGLKFETYDENSPIEEILEKRKINKGRFYDAFVKPYGMENKDPNLVVVEHDKSPIKISKEEFLEAPMIAFAHRLTSQKGLEHFKGAIFKLFDTWDEKFPGKPMPFVLVGGPSSPEKRELDYLYDLKNPAYGKNKARVDRVLALKGGLPNPAIMSVAQIFVAPSNEEPCGLSQAECDAKGTPILATDTGGYHDTIEDGVTGYLSGDISEEGIYNKLVKILDSYFNHPEKYNEVIKNDLKVDFSWAQKGKKGPIYEYTDKFGYDRKDLPDLAAAKKPVD